MVERRAFRAVAFLALPIFATGLARAAPPEVGSTVPDLTLETLAESQRTLSERDGPTVLVFFRGAW